MKFIFYYLSCLFILLAFVACQSKSNNKKVISKKSPFDKEINIALEDIRAFKLENAKNRLLSVSAETMKVKNWNANMKAHYELGIVYYSLSNTEKAIEHWKISAKMALLAHDTLSVASSNTNIGSAYMQKGYSKSAIRHFNKARKTYESLGVFNENYWINTVNIGVSYIELRDFVNARYILNRAKKSKSGMVSYFRYINLAKLEALENNKTAFTFNLEKATTYLKHVPYQENMLHEVDLEYSIRFNDVERIKLILERPFWKKQTLNFYQKTILNFGSLLAYGKPYSSEKDFHKMGQIMDQNKKDIKLYYEMLALYYVKKSDFKSAVESYNKFKKIDDEYEFETSTQVLDDYKLVERSEALLQKNKKLSEEQEDQSHKMQIISFLLGFAILFAIVLILAFVSMYRYNKQVIQLKEENMKLLNAQLSQSNEDKFKLESDLAFQEKRNQEIESNVKKIAILKKQLEVFFTSIQLSDLGENKTKVRNAKLDFDSFFSNYSDLAVLAATNSERYSAMSCFLEEKSHLLTDKEIQILALILNNFTTKEIGIIIGKSEKAIEYTRKSIRQKLSIPNEISLQDYLVEAIKYTPKNT